MRVSDAALELIMRFEGFRAEAYRDAAGIWTIGYGHTSMAGPPQVRPGMRITKAEAVDILRRDVERFARGVARAIGDEALAKLDENQFGALVSFAYNVGLGNFRRSSVLRAVRDGRPEDVPRLLLRWTKAGGRRLRGLVRRRRAEGRLWMTPPGRRRPPAVATIRHGAQEMMEHPDVAAAWAALLGAAATLAAGAWKEVTEWVSALF
jgi:lysozyme